MSGTFDFCTGSRVVTEIPPDEPGGTDMNGWMFTSKPKVPYRPSFTVKLYGLRWYLNSSGTALDVTTNPTNNAGRLREFYRTNRRFGVFAFNHEYLGSILCQFNKRVEIPAALPDSGGLIDNFEVELIQYNPAWN